MKRKSVRLASSLLASAIILSGCGGAISKAPVVVTPDLHSYSQDFQMKLHAEFESDVRAPCARDIIIEPCSAWKRANMDHGDMRAQVRAIEGN